MVSGSTSCSYSGSGTYTDTAGTSGIAFLVPGSASIAITGTVTGTASASGQVTSSTSASWTSTENASGAWTYSGSGSTTTSQTSDASYAGSGSFSASGAVTGTGTVSESGSRHTSGSAVSDYGLATSGVWTLQGGSASGTQSGSTSWSYSGSATYTDANAGSVIAYSGPGSASTTFTGTVTGTASASGQITTSTSGNWTATENASGAWAYSGSGSTTTSQSGGASYAGSGTFSASGAVTGSGTISESGTQVTSASGVSAYAVNATGNWVLQSNSVSGGTSGSATWSYSGSGTYTAPGGASSTVSIGPGTASSSWSSSPATLSGPAGWVAASAPAAFLGANKQQWGAAQFTQACFAAGTPLLTPLGDKTIESFRVGDPILSRAEGNAEGPVDVQFVEEVYVRQTTLWHLHVGGEMVRTTGEHPFWVHGRGWVATRELRIGEDLSSHDGQRIRVDDLLNTGEEATVYNLRVSAWHTYFVGSRQWGFSVSAHNQYTPASPEQEWNRRADKWANLDPLTTPEQKAAYDALYKRMYNKLSPAEKKAFDQLEQDAAKDPYARKTLEYLKWRFRYAILDNTYAEVTLKREIEGALNANKPDARDESAKRIRQDVEDEIAQQKAEEQKAADEAAAKEKAIQEWAKEADSNAAQSAPKRPRQRRLIIRVLKTEKIFGSSISTNGSLSMMRFVSRINGEHSNN